MKFDTDRFARLAGLDSKRDVKSTHQAPTQRSVMTEGSRRSASKSQLNESDDMKKLRSIIRRETLVVLKQMNESSLAVRDIDVVRAQKKKSLNEAIAMGFYGPGFGDSRASILGGAMTSGSRLFSITESEEDGLEDTDAEDADESLEEGEEDDLEAGEEDDLEEVGGSPDPESPNYDRDDERNMEKGG